MANALVGLVEERVEARVQALVDELAARFGLVGIREVPWPHVSFVVADGWDLAAVHEVATQVVNDEGLVVHAEPWTLFTGDTPLHPAIVRSVVRTADLATRQRDLLRACEHHVEGISPYLTQDRWHPHITLACRDLTPAVAGEVMGWLARTNPPTWTGRIDRLALIEDRGDHHVLAATVPC